MYIFFFLTLLFILQLFYWYVGKRASKNLKNTEDYFLAGKQVALFPLTMTFLATQIGGGAILGSAEEAFQYGWSILFYPLGIALGLIVLGSGVGKKLAEFNVSTVAQIFKTSYGSETLKRIASLLSILSLFMILVAQIIASNRFLISMGINNLAIFVLFWSVVILYTSKGGLKAVISTDLVQAIFFSSVFLIAFLIVFFTDPQATALAAPQWQDVTNSSGRLSGWLLMPFMFMLIEQDMAQRCFAGASSRIVSRASLLAGLLTMLICIVPVFFGALAKTKAITVLPGGSVLMTIINETTSPFFSAFVGAAVLAAIISTATSLINAISSNISNDFTWIKSSQITLIKWLTGIISLAALLFSFQFDSILGVLIKSYELSVSCLFVPVLCALFRKKGDKLSAYGAVLMGAFSFFFVENSSFMMPKEVISLLFSSAGFLIGGVLQSNLVEQPDG